MIGRTILVDGPYLYFDSSQIYFEKPPQKKINVITCLQASSCYDCMVQPLLAMEMAINLKCKYYDSINIWAIVSKVDIDSLQFSLKKYRIKSVVVVDTTNYFNKVNNLNHLLLTNRTFIIDKERKIVFVGHPIFRTVLQKQFCLLLDNLCRNQGSLNIKELNGGT
ncbi:MAG: hypothetical protein IK038_09660 [Bacteroidaceae bacterium]|nr:hypothetical protein [Bacteroidaceae bacterium]